MNINVKVLSKSLLVDVALYLAHLISIYFAFFSDIRFSSFEQVVLLFWLQIYYTLRHYPFFYNYINTVGRSDRFTSSASERGLIVFSSVPVVGPIIAILRIRYLQKEIGRIKK
jgi:hypothetical protein